MYITSFEDNYDKSIIPLHKYTLIVLTNLSSGHASDGSLLWPSFWLFFYDFISASIAKTGHRTSASQLKFVCTDHRNGT